MMMDFRQPINKLFKEYTIQQKISKLSVKKLNDMENDKSILKVLNAIFFNIFNTSNHKNIPTIKMLNTKIFNTQLQ